MNPEGVAANDTKGQLGIFRYLRFWGASTPPGFSSLRRIPKRVRYFCFGSRPAATVQHYSGVPSQVFPEQGIDQSFFYFPNESRAIGRDERILLRSCCNIVKVSCFIYIVTIIFVIVLDRMQKGRCQGVLPLFVVAPL